jgi:photosystem II stability/assembly factor-like uncharacterized protein
MRLKQTIIVLLTVTSTAFVGIWIFSKWQNQLINEEKIPNDWFFAQRAFPQGEINREVYKEAQRQAQAMKAQAAAARSGNWVSAGPTNIGGRVSDVELIPTSFDTIYAGAASGGVFKSVDGGQTWTPIFDDALSLSIGDIALDPSNSNIIYVGTGEVNAGGGSQTYDGFGLYRSTDGGQTWEHLGLEDTRYIGRVVIDPLNTRRIFVAAMGKLFGVNSERGLYRSTDGGLSWEQSLFISDSTGCIDVVIHPANPDTVYATMWERIRRPDRRSYGGVTCGLYRSYDGGDTWQELTGGLPNNSPNVGRIGISLCASQPGILYAIYADNIGYFDGVYKTTDGGNSWIRTNDGALGSIYASYGWWFGNIRVDPVNPNIVYAMGLDVYKTNNGGQSWFYSSGSMHVDQHGLYIHPQNPNYVVAGNDGGIYVSQNGGSGYTKSPNLPITQFYTGEVDYQFPERLYGGTQDNGTNRTLTGNPNQWYNIYSGDGFYVLVDPSDNNYVYAESQYGYLVRSTNGGTVFQYALSGVAGSRKNWSSPLAMDPSNPQVLYFGTERVNKTVNRAVSWTPVSPDLSKGPPSGNLIFGTITTIAVAPSDPNTIYAGTDDGNVWVTRNGGSNWVSISATLPGRWITRLAVDPFEARTAYVTLSGYRWDEYLPHILRTTDAGTTWEDISANLPEAPLNDVIVDPQDTATQYVASDVGVFYSQNLGISWQYIGAGLPNVPVTDLVLHNPTRMLVAATYGRSMFTYDLGQLTSLTDNNPTQPAGFELMQNYPNPFNAGTEIRFRLSASVQATLEIFDITGRKIKTLVDGIRPAGMHTVYWNGTNAKGAPAASGTYVYRLRVAASPEKANHQVFTKRMVVVK